MQVPEEGELGLKNNEVHKFSALKTKNKHLTRQESRYKFYFQPLFANELNRGAQLLTWKFR